MHLPSWGRSEAQAWLASGTEALLGCGSGARIARGQPRVVGRSTGV